jgi:hypothetical protein
LAAKLALHLFASGDEFHADSRKPPVGARHARDFFRGLCGLATAAIARAHGALPQVASLISGVFLRITTIQL